MIQAIAVDDETMALEILKRHAAAVPFLSLNHFFNTGKEALNFLQTNPVDLIFLDINMPGIHGLDLVKLLDPSVQVVFVTAHSNFAIHGFDLAITDFLLKPISQQRFQQACAVVLSRSTRNQAQEAIFIKDGHHLVRINFTDLIYIKADDNYLSFVEKHKYTLSRMKIGVLAERLPSHFFRIHKSYIINLNCINRIESARVIIGNAEIPVARAQFQQLKSKLNGLF